MLVSEMQISSLLFDDFVYGSSQLPIAVWHEETISDNACLYNFLFDILSNTLKTEYFLFCIELQPTFFAGLFYITDWKYLGEQ